MDICSEEDCRVRFSIVQRKHHCRKCGNVYCAHHSARQAFLFPATATSSSSPNYVGSSSQPCAALSLDEGPPSRPTTPKLSSLDIPGLAISSYFSIIPGGTCPRLSVGGGGASSNQSSPRNSPRLMNATPPIGTLSLGGGGAVLARVCDSCYFDVPLPHHPASKSSNPLFFSSSSSSHMVSPNISLRRPHSAHTTRHSTPLGSPSSISPNTKPPPSPLYNHLTPSTIISAEENSVRKGRSRNDSVQSGGSVPSVDSSTPPTSFSSSSVGTCGSGSGAGTGRSEGKGKSRGVSPAGSGRGTEEEGESETPGEGVLGQRGEEEKEERRRKDVFGSVLAEWSWSTF